MTVDCRSTNRGSIPRIPAIMIKKQAKDIVVGDTIELDVGYDCAFNDEWCKVLEIRIGKNVFDEGPFYNFQVRYGTEVWWTLNFSPTDLITVSESFKL